MIPVDTLWILQNRTIKLWEAKNEKGYVMWRTI